MVWVFLRVWGLGVLGFQGQGFRAYESLSIESSRCCLRRIRGSEIPKRTAENCSGRGRGPAFRGGRSPGH